MRDVAALARVSLKTVSRVVNDEPGVSPQLARKVQQAINRLDYRPNLGASSLRRSDRLTRTIGLLLEDVANPFSAALHRAIEDIARPRGVAVFTGSLDEDPVREAQLAATFIARRVDGLILVPASHDQSYLLTERRAGLPMVFVDRPPALLDADAVLSNNLGGAFEGVRHLLGRGHRSIGYLGDLMTISTAQERWDGYREALREYGVSVDAALVRHDLRTIAQAEQATFDVLTSQQPPTALFTSQNLVTIGAIRALRRLGKQHDVALVGFDDFLLADLLDPAVTVIAQDPGRMGAVAAQTLFDRLDGDSAATRRHVISTELVERGSGEIAPAQPPGR
jgi:LacI family transcriptional regulator